MSGWLGDLAAQAMQATTQGNPQALIALFLIASLTEVGVPFPLLLDGVLFLLGYDVLQSPLPPLAAVVVLLLGRELGSSSVYWLARVAGGRVIDRYKHRLSPLRRLVDRLTKKVGLQTSLALALARLGAQSSAAASIPVFNLRSSYTVAVARITPGLLTTVSVASGIVRLRYRYFAIGIGLASLFVDGAILALGATAHYGLLHFGLTPSPWLIAFAAFINILIIWLAARLLLRRSAPR